MTRAAFLFLGLALTTAPIACGDDDNSTPSGSTSSSAGGGTTSSAGGGGSGMGGMGGMTSSSSGMGGTTSSGGSGGGISDLIYASTFDGDSAAWPSPWVEAGGVLDADVVAGRARLVPFLSSYSLARMTLAASETDIEATFRFAFADVARQGIGFYVRQNGGYLQQSPQHGEGYAVFIEGFSGQPGVGIWHEQDGNEIEISDAPLALQDNVTYRARFRVEQVDASHTLLQARVWPDNESEPSGWSLELTDDVAHMQNISGGFAFDSWSINNGNPASDLFIDDVEILRLP